MHALFGILFVIIVLVGAYGYFSGTARAPETPVEQEAAEPRDEAQIEAYVRENIAALSPEPAVLGGTFYVTAIEAADGRGTVWYEDGHIALVADFAYMEDKYGVTVTSFEVRPQE